MTLYKGNTKIRDTGSYGVYKGNQPIRAIYKGSQLLYWQQLTKTFNASDRFQTYIVPANVKKIRVDCVAASGYNWGGGYGGSGGRVQCNLKVTPRQTLYLWVPQNPTGHEYSEALAYNAADIRTDNTGVINATSLNSRLIVAGGGGETHANVTYIGAGGAGGGLVGADGESVVYGGGGKGGTQSSGGAGGGAGGGVPGGSGRQGSFGLGGTSWSSNLWRGIGGAGWYGGGSGGASSYYGDGQGGGGGGSSYTNPSLCSNVVHTQGYQNGAGYITITEIG